MSKKIAMSRTELEAACIKLIKIKRKQFGFATGMTGATYANISKILKADQSVITGTVKAMLVEPLNVRG